MGQVLCFPKNGNSSFTNYTGGKISVSFVGEWLSKSLSEKAINCLLSWQWGPGGGEGVGDGGSGSDSLRQSMWLFPGRAPLDVKASCVCQE